MRVKRQELLLGFQGLQDLGSSYYVLAELFSLLMRQPSVTLQDLYHNTLSALLEAYFDIISSLLAIT
ncbi:MAG: hypothetical protein WCP96_18240 [Methylococcaceae bacterium]